MALKAILATLEGLSDALKAEYKPGEGDLAGKFVLDVTPTDGFELGSSTSLKSALQKERTTVSDLKKMLKKFEAITDVDAAVEALGKLEEIKNFNPDQKAAEAIRQRETQLTTKHKTETDKLNGQIASIQKQLEQVLIDNVATSAIASKKGSVKLLLPHVKTQVRLKQTDGGQYIAEVVDDAGIARLTNKPGSSSLLTIDELVEEMRGSDEFAAAFQPTGGSGTGASNNSGTGGGGGQQRQQGNKRTIAATDQEGLNSNLEAIASGEVTVTGV